MQKQANNKKYNKNKLKKLKLPHLLKKIVNLKKKQKKHQLKYKPLLQLLKKMEVKWLLNLPHPQMMMMMMKNLKKNLKKTEKYKPLLNNKIIKNKQNLQMKKKKKKNLQKK